ncbi:hypothetical protein WICMUC_002624 [Wickerhamomyces mucosus]|uniref:Uncharacterized protein n=1 Tax=Wickerhamomyces mucosus TaxID=1378264 RepID=A0A9P8PPX0_9ASCO|nr:hypothetical protein WICMUC_002624 [Wickerhamomyces mucosus]
MTSNIDKFLHHLNPENSDPLTSVKNLSPTLSYIHSHYPIVNEITSVILKISFINYIFTLIASLFLDFKGKILDNYFAFINNLFNSFDNFVKQYVFINGLNVVFPFLSTIHLKDFKFNQIGKHLQSSSYEILKWFEKHLNPILAPIFKFINSSLEYIIDNYLPHQKSSPSTKTNGFISNVGEVIEKIQPTETPFEKNGEEISEGLDKFVELTSTAIDRIQPIVEDKITHLKSVPHEIQIKVTKSSNELAASFGLAKSKAENSAQRVAEGVSNGVTTAINNAQSYIDGSAPGSTTGAGTSTVEVNA